MTGAARHGGDLVAAQLARHGIRTLFTLCGGHISPILVGAKNAGIRVIDTRHEATAVFAADATARLTGVPGVAAVTAGPGLTNAATAVKNAAMAQSPVLVFGGATATVLKGRGSLQDIDQVSLAAPLFKWQGSARRVADLAPLVERALWIAQAGVPGPVYLECPVDLLYPRDLVREWYGVTRPISGLALGKRVERFYLGAHLRRLFGADSKPPATSTAGGPQPPGAPEPAQCGAWTLKRAAHAVHRAERPLLVVGSQAVLGVSEIDSLVAAIERIGMPTWLSGMARGLLGADHPLLFRHRRKQALREADLVVLAGVPCDFRLDYGRSIPSATRVVAVNRERDELTRNRTPSIAAHGDPGRFLMGLARRVEPGADRGGWLEAVGQRERARQSEIALQAGSTGEGGINPLRLLRDLDAFLDERALLVADGGDFVGTAAYMVRPRAPLTWLDPGVFGTLGVGGGFALGAALARPERETWILFGDGSLGFSLAEIDTLVRHRVPAIALVGNDASWAQIAREQVTALGDEVGTALAATDYERAAEGLGARGVRIERPQEIVPAFEQARRWAQEGRPVLINARIARSDFRDGSISL